MNLKFYIEVKSMNKATKSSYYVKCRECGWEGYTLLRGYGSNGYLYLECENCGARNLYINPPPKGNGKIYIGGTILHDLTHIISKLILLGTYQIKITLENGWTWLNNQPKLRKYSLGGGFIISLSLIACLIIFRTYFLQFLIATIGTIASTLALIFRKE